MVGALFDDVMRIVFSGTGSLARNYCVSFCTRAGIHLLLSMAAGTAVRG